LENIETSLKQVIANREEELDAASQRIRQLEKENEELKGALAKAFCGGVDAAIVQLGFSSKTFHYPSQYAEISEWIAKAKNLTPQP
jgi:methyl coenzyme M reductase subunit C-like uncharacterized protein (methanogenesis marker protein 7)